VLKGELVFRVGGEEHALGPGDALHFRTERPHRWRNPGDRPTSALWMTVRPS
jgi:quercetin dioxygenase-like cupin family protein